MKRILFLIPIFFVSTSAFADENKIKNYIFTHYKKVPSVIVEEIARHTLEKSEKWDIPYELTIAVMEVESSFNPYSCSKARARGLMQVRYVVWGKVFGLKSKYDLHEVDIGIEAGIRVLKTYIEKTGSVDKALYKYVGGNERYVKRVNSCMERFKSFSQSSE